MPAGDREWYGHLLEQLQDCSYIDGMGCCTDPNKEGTGTRKTGGMV